jgi:hypothetical protein
MLSRFYPDLPLSTRQRMCHLTLILLFSLYK